MKELILNDGDITFTVDDTITGFENKLVNSLQIFGVETFWDTGKGLNFNIIASNQTEYKLSHIRVKLLEWYKDELEELVFTDIKIVGKVVKAKMKYIHKTFGKDEREVII